MKKNNKKIVIGLILFQFFLGACSMATEVQSFANGSYSGRLIFSLHWDKDQGAEWYSDHFGTHDWIGKGALDAVIAKDNWVIDNKNFWTAKRRWIFLVGTEAPDARRGDLTVELNDEIVYGMKTTSKIYFYDEDAGDNLRMGPKYDRWMGLVMGDTMRYTYKVIESLETGKCNLAAFFMGALCHLVGDMATFVHLTESGLYDNRYERHIQTQTKHYLTPEKTFHYPSLSLYDFTDFRTPPAIMLETAFYTMWNIHASWEDIIAKPKPEYFQANFPTADQCVTMLQSVSGGYDGYPYDLKCAVKNHLKEAVLASADLIHFFKPFWSGDCEDNDCGNNYESPNQGSGGDLGRGIANAMMIMVSLGIAQVLLAPVIQTILATMNHAV